MYCNNCGKEIQDGSKFCSNCGAEQFVTFNNTNNSGLNTIDGTSTKDSLYLVAGIFMIISCLTFGWCIIPLIWMVPMTIHAFNAYNKKTSVGTGFKICTLLFVNIIAGVCLLVADEVRN